MASLGRICLAIQLVWTGLALADKPTSSLREFRSPTDELDVNTSAQVSQQGPVGAVLYDSVWARVRHGINTECKTCPQEICPNKDWLQSSQQFRTTCWARGSKVNTTNLWLQHENGCYVSEFDTIPYFRNYTTDLKQCAPSQPKVTQQLLSIQQPASCHVCPHEKCEATREYAYNSRLNITCYASTIHEQCLSYCPRNNVTPDLNSILDNASPPPPEPERLEWLKTSDNCYVSVARVGRPGRVRIQGCGPVPYLELEYRNPITMPEDPLSPPPPPPSPKLPPPPACPNCAPFIWTFPQGNSATISTFSAWPFSPPWLTASANPALSTPLAPPPKAGSTMNPLLPASPPGQIPKLSTSLLTTPSVPKTTPSFPGLAPFSPVPVVANPPKSSSSFAILAPPAKAPSFSGTFDLGAAPKWATVTAQATVPALAPITTLLPTPPAKVSAPAAAAPPKVSTSSARPPLNLAPPFGSTPPKGSSPSGRPTLNLAPPFALAPSKASTSSIPPALNPALPFAAWTPPKASSSDVRPVSSAPPFVTWTPPKASSAPPFVAWTPPKASSATPLVAWTLPKASTLDVRPSLNLPPPAKTAAATVMPPVSPPKASSSAGLLSLGVWPGLAKALTPVATRNAPLTTEAVLPPKVAASLVAKQSMVLTMSVFVAPAVCKCGAIQCPEDPALRYACTAFASQNCASQCAPTTHFYTMTVDPLTFPTPANWTAPPYGNFTKPR